MNTNLNEQDLIEAAHYCLNGAIPMSEAEAITAWNRLDVMTLMLDAEVRIHTIAAQAIPAGSKQASKLYEGFYFGVGAKARRHLGVARIEIHSAIKTMMMGVKNCHSALTGLRLGSVKSREDDQPISHEMAVYYARHILWSKTNIREFIGALAVSMVETVMHYPVDKAHLDNLIKHTLQEIVDSNKAILQEQAERGEVFRGMGFVETYNKLLPELVSSLQSPKSRLIGVFTAALSLTNWKLTDRDLMDDLLSGIAELVLASEGFTPEQVRDLVIRDRSQGHMFLLARNDKTEMQGFSVN